MIENSESIRIIGKIKTRNAHVAKEELVKIIKTKFKEEETEF